MIATPGQHRAIPADRLGGILPLAQLAPPDLVREERLCRMVPAAPVQLPAPLVERGWWQVAGRAVDRDRRTRGDGIAYRLSRNEFQRWSAVEKRAGQGVHSFGGSGVWPAMLPAEPEPARCHRVRNRPQIATLCRAISARCRRSSDMAVAAEGVGNSSRPILARSLTKFATIVKTLVGGVMKLGSTTLGRAAGLTAIVASAVLAVACSGSADHTDPPPPPPANGSVALPTTSTSTSGPPTTYKAPTTTNNGGGYTSPTTPPTTTAPPTTTQVPTPEPTTTLPTPTTPPTFVPTTSPAPPT